MNKQKTISSLSSDIKEVSFDLVSEKLPDGHEDKIPKETLLVTIL